MNSEEIKDAVDRLTPRQLARVSKLIEAMSWGVECSLLDGSDIATREFGEAFGEYIESHHLGSTRALSKENFEYAMVSSLTAAGRVAEKTVSNTLSGQDIIVDGVPWSLKSEAARNIRVDRIHISKFMELGKGAWQTEADLHALRQRMFAHLDRYDRIFTLRCIDRQERTDGTQSFTYELVEIPKQLFEQARDVPIHFATGSRQSPVPASCFVPIDSHHAASGRNNISNLLLELYFDGGTERKLQIRKIAKSHCIVHAQWTVVTAV